MSDLNWDAFVASLHRVWEYAPDFSPTGPVSLSGRKVLVADRDAEHNDQLADRLKRLGSSAITTISIESAVRKLEKTAIDLIVVAADFPNDSSLDFCRVVSDSSATLHIPIIMLSNDDRPEMVWAARRAGASFYLRKPYDPYVLLALMSAAMEPAEP